MISTQLLREFVDAGLRKLALDVAHVRSQLAAHLQFGVVPVTPTIIRGALDLHQTRSLAFYDAIIVQSAIIVGCNTLYSEDLTPGEVIQGVRIVNPFA